MSPPGGYSGGKIKLKISKPEAGVKIYLEQNKKSISPKFGN